MIEESKENIKQYIDLIKEGELDEAAKLFPIPEKKLTEEESKLYGTYDMQIKFGGHSHVPSLENSMNDMLKSIIGSEIQVKSEYMTDVFSFDAENCPLYTILVSAQEMLGKSIPLQKNKSGLHLKVTKVSNVIIGKDIIS